MHNYWYKHYMSTLSHGQSTTTVYTYLIAFYSFSPDRFTLNRNFKISFISLKGLFPKLYFLLYFMDWPFSLACAKDSLIWGASITSFHSLGHSQVTVRMCMCVCVIYIYTHISINTHVYIKYIHTYIHNIYKMCFLISMRHFVQLCHFLFFAVYLNRWNWKSSHTESWVCRCDFFHDDWNPTISRDSSVNILPN